MADPIAPGYPYPTAHPVPAPAATAPSTAATVPSVAPVAAPAGPPPVMDIRRKGREDALFETYILAWIKAVTGKTFEKGDLGAVHGGISSIELATAALLGVEDARANLRRKRSEVARAVESEALA